MNNRTFTQENQTTFGGITILANQDAPGVLEVEGTVYTDTIDSNVPEAGVNISSLLIKNSTIKILPVSEPSVDVSGSILFLDQTDNKLKTINADSSITNIQPLTSKGDILTHNGTTQIRVPVGINGQVLSSNSASSSGLEWITSSGGSSVSSINNIFSAYLTSTNSVYLQQHAWGAFIHSITPMIENGSSCNFLISKSNITIIPNITRLNNNTSIINSNDLIQVWNNYKGISLYKNYSEADGAYSYMSNFLMPKNIISLTGTSSSSIYSSTTGAYFISIHSRLPGGPSANIVVLKNNATNNSGVVNIINSSPGTSGNQFNVSWLSNAGLSISKTNSNNNGEYVILNNFEIENYTQDITLSGTGSIQIGDFSFYDKKSCWIKVYSSSISGSPIAFFSVSKNLNTRIGNITRFSVQGIVSNTNLNLQWNSNSGLFINKTNNNYNGVYTISFTNIE